MAYSLFGLRWVVVYTLSAYSGLSLTFFLALGRLWLKVGYGLHFVWLKVGSGLHFVWLKVGSGLQF